MENLMYELIFAREESWVMGKYRADLFLLIDAVLQNFVKFFTIYFNFMIEVFSDKTLQKTNVAQKVKSQWNKYLKDLGKIQSLGKKQGENRYWYLVEYVSDFVDFNKLFQAVPEDNTEVFQMFKIQVLSVIDERKRKILLFEEQKKMYQDGYSQVVELEGNEIPDVKFVEQVITEDLIKQEEKKKRQEEFQKKKDEEEQKIKEEQQIQEGINKMEEKQEMLTWYRKGAQTINLKMSEEQQQQYNQKTILLAMEYDDEPDDSYNYFQPQASANQEQEIKDIEDQIEEIEYDENGNKKQLDEGLDDGRQNRNQNNFVFTRKRVPNKGNYNFSKQSFNSNNQQNNDKQQKNQ
ncbi:hypothetical protein IMG5_119020, partial [Ichthyophthirius multifiliis]